MIREDPSLPDLLYAGTDCGLFISLNGGKSWESFQQNLPITPVTDIKVYRDDLVISTMGRGFWVLDNLPRCMPLISDYIRRNYISPRIPIG